MQGERVREALDKHWQESVSGDANAEQDIYSQGSEFSGEARPCGDIIQASRPVSTSSEFSETVTSGSRNT